MDTQTLSMLSYINAHPGITLLLIIWSTSWKLIALWKAAERNHLTIFIVLGVLNIFGIPEIIYIIYLYLKERKNKICIQVDSN